MKTFKEFNDWVNSFSIEKTAYEFYNNQEIDFEERFAVFNKYGKTKSYYYDPEDENLAIIFQETMDNLDKSRYENISCDYIIEKYVYSLARKKKKNNSKQAVDRLFKYYMEKLFKEGISNFNYDW